MLIRYSQQVQAMQHPAACSDDAEYQWLHPAFSFKGLTLSLTGYESALTGTVTVQPDNACVAASRISFTARYINLSLCSIRADVEECPYAVAYRYRSSYDGARPTRWKQIIDFTNPPALTCRAFSI